MIAVAMREMIEFEVIFLCILFSIFLGFFYFFYFFLSADFRKEPSFIVDFFHRAGSMGGRLPP